MATASRDARSTPRPAPFVTYLPDALAHGVEVRAGCTAARVEIDVSGRRATGITYVEEATGRERFHRARVVAIASYLIESPRLLFNSVSGRRPHSLGNGEGQVGR